MDNRSITDTIGLEGFAEMLFEKNGPDPDEYEEVLRFVDMIKADEVEAFRQVMKPILTPASIIGFCYSKPFGYSGDFFIIEKIYQKFISTDSRYRKWDEFAHRFPAVIAVVNRKKLAIEVLRQFNEKASVEGEKSVLILGSGPATEVNEYLRDVQENHLVFDMIDLDQRAIDYAKNKNREYLHCMRFENKNVIRYLPEKQYDLIWSAGLFDYFKDKHFVFLLKKFYEYVLPGGEMIIGNFNVENPSRKIMEVLGDWFLFHRSKEELLGFAHQAGIPAEKASVLAEPIGVNLFLRTVK
jgi:extracellular factor (EF) 3-hydroxypalmitic acid methyl ester biosynthesis protein